MTRTTVGLALVGAGVWFLLDRKTRHSLLDLAATIAAESVKAGTAAKAATAAAEKELSE